MEVNEADLDLGWCQDTGEGRVRDPATGTGLAEGPEKGELGSERTCSPCCELSNFSLAMVGILS